MRDKAESEGHVRPADDYDDALYDRAHTDAFDEALVDMVLGCPSASASCANAEGTSVIAAHAAKVPTTSSSIADLCDMLHKWLAEFKLAIRAQSQYDPSQIAHFQGNMSLMELARYDEHGNVTTRTAYVHWVWYKRGPKQRPGNLDEMLGREVDVRKGNVIYSTS